MNKDETLKFALEALKNLIPIGKRTADLQTQAINAVEAALEAKDEPVAWQYRDANDDGTWTAWNGCDKRLTESDWRKVRPLYTTPPQRTWIGLTDEHKEGLICMTDPNPEPHHLRELIDVVEFQLKEKNT